MTHARRPTRRGVALLLVLGALIVSVTAAATLARVAATTKMQRRADLATAGAHDLLHALEAPIRHWLATDSAHVVLSPETVEPRVEVLNETWTVGGTVFEVTVTAWDQCGMVPIERARSGSPLRLALSPEARDVLDRVNVPSREPAGLDHFAAALTPVDGLQLFPAGSMGAPTRYSAPDVVPDAETRRVIVEQAPPPVAIGAILATHNPMRVNVNTAPVELLEAACRATGRGGVETILAARAAGTAATVAPARTPERRGAGRTLDLAGSSSAWAFRVDVRAGPVARSWWSVYVRSDSSWECVQRLAITD